MGSLPLQSEYGEFKASLEPLLESAERSKDLRSELRAALDVLNQWKEKKARLLHELQTTETSASVEDIGDKNFQADVTTIDGVFRVLVHAAVQDFGPIARDVYEAIFEPRLAYAKRQQAIDTVTYADLQKLCKTFQKWTALPQQTISHCIIAVEPVAPADEQESPDETGMEKWTIDYRSIPIARKMSEKLDEEKYEWLIDLFTFFRSSAQSSPLSGRIFEHIANRKLRTDVRKDLVLVKMCGNLSVNTPVLDVDFDKDIPEAYTKLPGGDRELVYFQSREFSNLTDEAYYVPGSSTFPLFDSFLVERRIQDTTDVDLILWVFRMSTSPTHGGSREGYASIRRVIKLLKSSFGTIEVKDKDGKVKMGNAVQEPQTD